MDLYPPKKFKNEYENKITKKKKKNLKSAENALAKFFPYIGLKDLPSECCFG